MYSNNTLFGRASKSFDVLAVVVAYHTFLTFEFLLSLQSLDYNSAFFLFVLYLVSKFVREHLFAVLIGSNYILNVRGATFFARKDLG